MSPLYAVHIFSSKHKSQLERFASKPMSWQITAEIQDVMTHYLCVNITLRDITLFPEQRFVSSQYKTLQYKSPLISELHK